MIQKEILLEVIDSWENLAFAINEIGNRPEYFGMLMEIALNDPGPKSWRAAWMADKINEKYPEMILPYLDSLAEKMKTETHDGKKRQFLKFISLNPIGEQHFGFLTDYCFRLVASDKEPPSVRVHAMQVLFNISGKIPELKSELAQVIEHEMEYHATPGIISRGRRLLKKLYSRPV